MIGIITLAQLKRLLTHLKVVSELYEFYQSHSCIPGLTKKNLKVLTQKLKEVHTFNNIVHDLPPLFLEVKHNVP